MIQRICNSLLEVKVWTAVIITAVIFTLGFFLSAFVAQFNQAAPVERLFVRESLPAGDAEAVEGELPLLLLLPSLSSPQARSHYRQQLAGVLQQCRTPLHLHLLTPTQYVSELAQMVQELAEERGGPAAGCRLRYTLLRGGEQLASTVDQKQRGRRMLAVLRQLAPLGRVVFMDEQTLPAADLSPLLDELAVFDDHQLAAAAPEDTARYLSRAQLEGVADQLPSPGVSGRLLLLDLPRLAAEPSLEDSTAELPPTDTGLQPDVGGVLTQLRRGNPHLVRLLPCQWTVSKPERPPPLDALFSCPQSALVVSTAARAEAEWERDVLRQWVEQAAAARSA